MNAVIPELRNYTLRPDLLKDRVILVTGASGSIGKALSLAAAALGATVLLQGRSLKKLEAIDDAIQANNGPPAALIPIDFEKAGPTEYDALITSIENNFGRLDGLVHNAAMLGERAPLAHYDIAKWQRTLHVNINAPFILTRYCLPLLQRAADASIIFSSCDIAIKPRAYWGAYLTSKWALEGMMYLLADELENAGNMRVNSVDPGPVASELRAQAFPAEERAALPTPQQVITPYLYLLSTDSRGITGQRLTTSLHAD